MYQNGIIANAQGLWHPLDFLSRSSLDERKIDGLTTLALSPRSERQAFLDLSIARTDLSNRLAYGLPYVLNAAVGVDVELHDRLVQRIRSAPRSGARAMPFVDRVLAQQWLGEEPNEEPNIDEFFGAIEKTTNVNQLYTLGQGLSALAGELDAAQAQAVVPKVLEMIEKTTNVNQLYTLGQGLSALAGELDADQKAYALDAIGASMLRTRSGVQGYFLARSAGAFLKGTRLNDQRASYWIEACRHPFVDRSEVARAIRLGNPGAPSEEQGLWALLRWAVAEYKIDPRASLKPPVAENR
jgi:hypothetical protein